MVNLFVPMGGFACLTEWCLLSVRCEKDLGVFFKDLEL